MCGSSTSLTTTIDSTPSLRGVVRFACGQATWQSPRAYARAY